MSNLTRREHSTATVQDGGKVVVGPNANIEGFGGGRPKSVQTQFAAHPSTPFRQLAGNPGNGHSVTSQTLPPVPIRADNNSGKRFDPAPSHSSVKGPRVGGYTQQDCEGHGASIALCDEAVHSGSSRMPGEQPHWKPSTKNLIGD
jgi:hypothetical protein